MDSWIPAGDPRELCFYTPASFVYESRIQKLMRDAKTLEKEQERRKAAPRGRTYNNWKSGLTAAEIQMLEKNGMPVTLKKPPQLIEMKELVRTFRNAKSAYLSRERARDSTKR